jgi:hypothetical protein
MIKNRNIASDAGIDVTKIIGSDIGEVRYVCRENTNSHAMLKGRVPSSMLYLCDGTADEVQINQAIAASKGGTNSYIYVFPGSYTLAAAISFSGKSSMHLIGANGLNRTVGTNGAVALTQGGSCVGITMEAYGEVAGLQIINKAGYAAIDVPANIWRTNIHHNTFWMTQGSACYIVAVGNAASYGNISYNRFSTGTGGNFTAVIGSSTGTGIDIIGNHITIVSGTVTYGIYAQGAQCMVADNYISTCGSLCTITHAIDIWESGAAVNNRCAVATTLGINGGTASVSFVDNRDGASGGAAAVTT